MRECEGKCGEHRGRVRLVHVTGYFDWGHWYYCENAIECDRLHGFDVEVVPDDDEEVRNG